jgi:SAM-dependent methyltransferase/uncharacterized protein YbaR (Trm112 family)
MQFMACPPTRLPPSFPASLLRCPVCQSPLEPVNEGLGCQNPGCTRVFPICDGVPVLIAEEKSTLTISDVLAWHKAPPKPPPGLLRSLVRKMTPTRGRNVRGAENYRRLAALLLDRTPTPAVLVVGGQIIGQGMNELLSRVTGMVLVETDIAWGPRTAVVCDAHDLPFAPGTFDAVIIQGVLQYLVDPVRCVGEIHRVLKPEALVYAETGFMQQVNVGAFDFVRFSPMGHRRLFRWFEEVSSGAVCGPGMALGWSYEYFLTSFFEGKLARQLVTLFARYTSFYLKYLDSFLVSRRGALDAASGVFFLGRKAEKPFADRDFPNLYRGLTP